MTTGQNDVDRRNKETSRLEVKEWLSNPPNRYFLYIRESAKLREPDKWLGNVGPAHEGLATTWMGDVLGTVLFGRRYRSNFGDWRIPVTVLGRNGWTYRGTYFQSAGNYARVKRTTQNVGG